MTQGAEASLSNRGLEECVLDLQHKWRPDWTRTHGPETEPAAICSFWEEGGIKQVNSGNSEEREAGTGGLGMDNTGFWIFLITTCAIPGRLLCFSTC